MTITIETSDILTVLKSLNIKSISIKEAPVKRQPVTAKGDKKLNPRELFGIWKENPRTLEQVRIFGIQRTAQ